MGKYRHVVAAMAIVTFATTIGSIQTVTSAHRFDEPNWKTFPVQAGGQSHAIWYSITDGKVVEMASDRNSASFAVDISSTERGRLVIELPRELIDSMDDDFVMFVDDIPVDFNEIEATDTTITLEINFEHGSERIEIMGSFLPCPRPSAKEWTAHTVGKFLNSEPPRPDQIFKLHYRVINGTMDSFRINQEIDDVFVHTGFTASVNSSGNGMLEIKFPRNFPYSNSGGGRSGEFLFFDDKNAAIEGERRETDCFFVFSIPFSGSNEIGMALASIFIKSPYRGDDVPDSWIPQTIVEDVPARQDGSITPLQQFRAGVAAEHVFCPEGSPEFVLMISSSGKTYCVDPSDVRFVQARGWVAVDQAIRFFG